MSNVYEFISDYSNYSQFREKYSHIDNKFIYKYWGWKEINLSDYQPVEFELLASDMGKKNYKMDVSTFGQGIIVFSERAIEALKDILEQSGQIITINTSSKTKKFFGFYPNKNVYDLSIVNLNKSDYREEEKGKIFYKIVLNNNYPKDKFIFTIDEYPTKAFVTEKFKELVEKHDLKGFSFNRECVID